MRILQVGNFLRDEVAGGVEVLTQSLSRELARRGHDVTLAAFSARGGRTLELDGYRALSLPCPREVQGMPVPGADARRELVRLVEEADIVHAHFPHPIGAFLAGRAAVQAGRPLVVNVNSHMGIGPVARDRGLGYRALAQAQNWALLRPTLRRADIVFAISPGYLDINPATRGFDAKTRLLPLGVDVDHFRPGLDGAGVRRRLGLDGSVVAFVGSLRSTHRGKGLDVLIRAVANLIRNGWRGKVQLLVVAEGELAAEYGSLAAKEGLGSAYVHAPGVSRADLPAHLAAADVFALPSVWPEAFGLVLAEAMACGVPVVGARSGGIPYVVGDAGLLVKPGDVEALAGALELVLTDHVLARRLRSAGPARVLDAFTWAKAADVAERTYTELLDRGAGSS